MSAEKTKMKAGGIQFLNRDISWLEFNSRVLDEAADKGNPLLERLKFLAIFSSNLDEFFMVRIAGISGQLGTKFHRIYKDYGYDPAELLAELDRRIRNLVERQYRYLNTEILPELRQNSIVIATWNELTTIQKNTALKLMNSEIFPVLTPIGVDQSHPFPLVPNLGLELLIRLVPAKEDTEKFAVLEVPPVIPRFIQLESSERGLVYIAAEELIRNNLNLLFSGCEIKECALFRVTRDMDFSIDEESIADLMTEIQIALRKKTKRNLVRLELSSGISAKSRKWLLEKLNIAPTDHNIIQPVNGILNLKSMFALTSIQGYAKLIDEPMPPLSSPHLLNQKDMFAAIREKHAFIVHHPYESFDPVVKLLEQAAADPDVLAIKQTLYRVSGNSPVVKALINAARNGKQVSVLVELKARFDEENNIIWARELAEAGAHVVYGIAGLKVHCKALMIIRREEEGIHRYLHLSTGNYNDKTARLYTDIGYFTDDKLLANDIAALFNVITGFSTPPEWNKLIVAPFNMLESLIFLIDREARISTKENPGHIIIKVNSVIDYEVIEHLYDAARHHVKIELIVRGICGLTPYSLPPEYAKNISITSILDRYLEHSRIYYFLNNGSPEYYMGSADIMPRNLRRRIELLFPVDSEEIREELNFILKTDLCDRRKGRRVTGINQYSKTTAMETYEKTRSQVVLYHYYRDRLTKAKEAAKPGNGNFTIFKQPDR